MQVPAVRVRNGLAAGLLTVLVVWVTSARAADRFVSTTGSDTANDCLTSTNPCRTVGYALTQAASGDTVKVAQGTYQETLVINVSTTLTLSGGWTDGFGVQSRTSTIVGSLASEVGSGDISTVAIDAFTVTGAPGAGVAARSLGDGSLT